MKTRLNLMIDDALLNSMKAYASSKQTSISELVENYFKKITRPAKRKNIITLVEKLERPDINPKAGLKESFYKDRAKNMASKVFQVHRILLNLV